MERIRRFFNSNKTKYYKHFCIQNYQGAFGKKYLKDYFETLDGYMQMKGQLNANFDYNKAFGSYTDDDEIQFDDLYDILTRWAVSEQDKLKYEDFAVAEE